MNILHTAHSYPPDATGVAHVLKAVSTRLAARGHNVTVFTERRPNTPVAEDRDGVHIHRFNIAGNLVDGVRGDAASYLGAVQAGQWDVIVMHCFQSWSTDVLLQHVQSLGTPCVVVAHGLSYYPSVKFADYYAWV